LENTKCYEEKRQSVRLLHLLSFMLTFSRSWVRVFEIGSARIAEAAAIKADIDTAGKRYAY
jgi:hypothetical protein